MTGDDLPDEDQFVRYARPTDVLDDESLNCSAFMLRSDESGLSVNWLDYFRDRTKSEQLSEIRRLSRLTMRRNGRLAELNVEEVRERVRQELDAFRFIHDPLAAEGQYEPDPSHSQILGLPTPYTPEAQLIGFTIAECVTEAHPAVA